MCMIKLPTFLLNNRRRLLHFRNTTIMVIIFWLWDIINILHCSMTKSESEKKTRGEELRQQSCIYVSQLRITRVPICLTVCWTRFGAAVTLIWLWLSCFTRRTGHSLLYCYFAASNRWTVLQLNCPVRIFLNSTEMVAIDMCVREGGREKHKKLWL